ncbi:hypothetical protein [Psychromonas aquimarina]|uniref:hypothetical protein n=1 Tax=Psychromonas aquimarina TaxID=444919 RepID=UPI0004063B31|nr:hypothetical protein [Psychromonas aquimarina]
MKYKKSASNVLWGVLALMRLMVFSFITFISFIFISLMSFVLMGLMLVTACFQKIESFNKTKKRHQQKTETKLLELKDDKP